MKQAKVGIYGILPEDPGFNNDDLWLSTLFVVQVQVLYFCSKPTVYL